MLNSNCTKDEIMVFVESMKMPKYYKEMIYAWFSLKESNENNRANDIEHSDIQNEKLWFNSNIKDYNKNVIFFKKW